MHFAMAHERWLVLVSIVLTLKIVCFANADNEEKKILGRAVVHMASPVASHTGTFVTLMNKKPVRSQRPDRFKSYVKKKSLYYFFSRTDAVFKVLAVCRVETCRNKNDNKKKSIFWE